MNLNFAPILIFPPNMCRICVDFNEKVQNIEETFVSCEGNLLSLLELLNFFSDIKINVNNPSKICSNCVTKAIEAYHFKIQCDKSTQILKELKETIIACDNKSPEITNQNPHLREELKEESSSEITTKQKEEYNKENSNEEVEKIPFSCLICSKVFTNGKALEDHNLTHTFASSSDTTTTVYEKPKIIHHKTESICKLCNKQFKKPSHLKYHMMLHNNDRPYICHICGNRYTTNFILREHIRQKHERRNLLKKVIKKRFLCPICGLSLRTKSQLDAHSDTHSKERKYQCEKCGIKFSQHCQLYQHRVVHKDEKPFECKECGKAFSRKYVLKKHTLIHTGSKPHVCKICNKAFIEMTALKYHMRIHTADKKICPICGKGLTRNSVLQRHIKEVHYKSDVSTVSQDL